MGMSLFYDLQSRRLVFSLLASLLLAGCGSSVVDCRLKPDDVILAVGDSLTEGIGAAADATYPAQLSHMVGRPVVAAGLRGERTEGLIKRLPALLKEHKPALVFITIGGNDFLQRVPREITRRELSRISQLVLSYGATPVFFSIPGKTMGAFVGQLSDDPLYDELKKVSGVGVIPDVVTSILNDASLKSDPVHPNAQGYLKMAQAAANVVHGCTVVKR